MCGLCAETNGVPYVRACVRACVRTFFLVRILGVCVCVREALVFGFESWCGRLFFFFFTYVCVRHVYGVRILVRSIFFFHPLLSRECNSIEGCCLYCSINIYSWDDFFLACMAVPRVGLLTNRIESNFEEIKFLQIEFEQSSIRFRNKFDLLDTHQTSIRTFVEF